MRQTSRDLNDRRRALNQLAEKPRVDVDGSGVTAQPSIATHRRVHGFVRCAGLSEKWRWDMLTVMKRILRLLICFGLAARATSAAGMHFDGPGSGVSRGNTTRRVVRRI